MQPREDNQDRTSGSDTHEVERPEDRGFKSHRSRFPHEACTTIDRLGLLLRLIGGVRGGSAEASSYVSKRIVKGFFLHSAPRKRISNTLDFQSNDSSIVYAVGKTNTNQIMFDLSGDTSTEWYHELITRSDSVSRAV